MICALLPILKSTSQSLSIHMYIKNNVMLGSIAPWGMEWEGGGEGAGSLLMRGLLRTYAKWYLKGHILIVTKWTHGALKRSCGVWITLKSFINSSLQRQAMKGDKRWKDEIQISKEQTNGQRKETIRQEVNNNIYMERGYDANILDILLAPLLLPLHSFYCTQLLDVFYFIRSYSGSLKLSQRQNKRKRQQNWSSRVWRLHHSDSLQTSVTYNLPWQSHINTNLCWQGTVLEQTKLPFETVTRMYRQKRLFSQEGWTFWSVGECLYRVFESLSVWYLGPC